MPGRIAVLVIDRPHFTVRLYENILRIDLKGSFKNEIEEALENKPVLRETFGGVLGIFVPLHVRLKDVHSVNVYESGKVKINLPHHRNINIPLEREDGERFAEKLNELVSKTRQKEEELEHLRRKRARDLKRKSKQVRPSSYVTVPYYFPTEQADIVGKLQQRKRKKK